MLDSNLTRRAVEVAISVAIRGGLRCGSPRVLGGHSNTLVHLHPHPVVARVATGTGLVREGPDWLGREVAVTRFLAAAGAPAIRPSELIDPGPHQFDGLSLSFWPLLREDGGRRSLREAGAALRICHEALASFSGELPPLATLEETRRLLAHPRVVAAEGEAKAAEVGRTAERILSTLREHAAAFRPLHGDAHPGNLLATDDGALWIDWEDTFLGPIEWDLACLVTKLRLDGNVEGEREALGGYGAPYDEKLLECMIEARCLQRVVWSALLHGG